MIKQYTTYVLVGVVITLVTVGFRALLGLVMPDETTFQYLTTIVVAYLFGIVLSLLAHKSITFRWNERLSGRQVGTFVLVHLSGMCANLAGSALLRPLLDACGVSDQLSKTLAFGIAAFAVSFATFAGKKLLVFQERESARSN